MGKKPTNAELTVKLKETQAALEQMANRAIAAENSLSASERANAELREEYDRLVKLAEDHIRRNNEIHDDLEVRMKKVQQTIVGVVEIFDPKPPKSGRALPY